MKKLPKKPFFVEGMTAKQILDLPNATLNSLKERDFSRALRTVALVANKRLNRLLKYSKKRGGKYIEKVNGPGLDLTALNSVGGKKFGVGNKNLNQMRQEFARVQSFMRSVTSTLSGAISVRKKKEVALFGQTREEMTKGMDKKQKKEKISEINQIMPAAYDTYDDYLDEYAMKGGYNKESGSMVLQDIGRDMLEGLSPEAAKANANMHETQRTEGEEEKEPDFWDQINGEKEWWEDI